MSIFMFHRAVFAAVLLLCISFGATADDEVNVGPDGVAIHGYDVVAYFDPGKAVKGKKAFSARHFGVTYRFSSAETLATFMKNPDKYLPAYGGWCSYGVRVGKKFDIDPSAWKIVDERLFLQLDHGTQKVWKNDLAKNIEIADRLWPKIQSTSAAALGQ